MTALHGLALRQRPSEIGGRASLLGGLDAREFEQLLGSARFHIFPAGASLVAQGSVVDALVIVLSGHIKQHHLTTDGREVILEILGPGDVIGQLSSIDSQPALAGATALENVEVLLLPGTQLAELLRESPRLACLLLRELARRVRAGEQERIELMTCDATMRMARRLLELAERWGRPCAQDGVEIGLSVSQASLAARAGVSREAAVKSLQSLRERGLIRTSRRRIEILDVEGLRRRACY